MLKCTPTGVLVFDTCDVIFSYLENTEHEPNLNNTVVIFSLLSLINDLFFFVFVIDVLV